jgi:branched-subunit amino acid aminotransferase/4-amino-4-deoxychorismate lyase
MSMTEAALYRWNDGALRPLDYCDPSETTILAADSWLVADGDVLALDLHRQRFLDATRHQLSDERLPVEEFWDASINAISATGDSFPRVELQRFRGAERLVFRDRSAPELGLSVVLASHDGPDPRTQPTIKGPDTNALLAVRTAAQERGAGEAVILSPDGYVVEGAYSGIIWWHGDALCVPSPELERVDSVTVRSTIALATALGIDVFYESVTPDGLDGREVWVLSALHGIRIATGWVDGPSLAAEPGRLALWRARLDRLRKPLPPKSPR